MRALLFTIATALLFTTSSFEKPHKNPPNNATLYSSCTTCTAGQIQFWGSGYPKGQEIHYYYKGPGVYAGTYNLIAQSDGKGNINFDVTFINPGTYTVWTYYFKAGNPITLSIKDVTVE